MIRSFYTPSLLKSETTQNRKTFIFSQFYKPYSNTVAKDFHMKKQNVNKFVKLRKSPVKTSNLH